MKYKKELIVLSIVILIPVLIISIYMLTRGDVSVKRKTKDSKLPYINMKSNDVDTINKLLDDLYQKYTSKGGKFNYKKFENDKIILILVIIDEYEDKDNYTRKYLSYNIDKKTKEFVSNEDIALLYNLDIEDIYNIVDNRLKTYYDEEYKEGYVDYDCDYECYLSYMRGMDNIMDNVSLTVEDNKIVAYINLNIDSLSGDEEYFNSLKYESDRLIIKE